MIMCFPFLFSSLNHLVVCMLIDRKKELNNLSNAVLFYYSLCTIELFIYHIKIYFLFVYFQFSL